MPTYKFLVYEETGKDFQINISDLKNILPEHFSVKKEKEGLIITINYDKKDHKNHEDPQKEAEKELERELNRIYFITSYNLKHKTIQANNKKILECQLGWEVYGDISKLDRQEWKDDRLDVQLALWRMAEETESLPLKILLNYLIVEIDRENDIHNNCLKYKYIHNNHPYYLRECYLIRNLIAHQFKVNKEVKDYCKFLGIPQEHYNPYNKEAENKLRERYNKILREEAKKIIKKKLSMKD